MDFSNFIPALAAWFGLQPTTMLFVIGLIVALANAITKYIPDNATGFWGSVRKVAAIIGLYVPSRATPDYTISQAARAALATPAVAANLESPGVTTASGAKLSSPWFVGIAVLVLAWLVTGCATFGGPVTPAQKLYAAFGTYDVALREANAYAAMPGANPSIVHALNQANQDARPAVLFVRAFKPCTTGATVFQGTSCTHFDFSAAGIMADVGQLENFTKLLQAR